MTVKPKLVPAVPLAGAVMRRRAAAAPLTVIVPELQWIVPVTVSVKGMVWLPAVFNVAENVPAPFVNGPSEGKAAVPSLLVKCTVPA